MTRANYAGLLSSLAPLSPADDAIAVARARRGGCGEELRLAAPFIAEDKVEGGRCCGGRRSVSSARWLLVAMSIIF